MVRVDNSFTSTRNDFRVFNDSNYQTRGHKEQFEYPNVRLPPPSVQYTKINTSNYTSAFAVTNPAFYRKSNLKILRSEPDKDIYDKSQALNLNPSIDRPYMTNEQKYNLLQICPLSKSTINRRHPDDVVSGGGMTLNKKDYITAAQWASHRMPISIPAGTISY
tara:strand:+ start:2870 stop:3358 length:489 start_codon:yes stop_codon:yes gene_type:complete